ncbi:hypothetical protein [Endozoicomonas sp. SCSIO W0465]|uniref:hypothetical protein n=1 Tax=Endozoicomonas sp. SCSIO W0465 TaxID=2918516 RepID=UPI0020760661|nr:hypothetical protein [Endozoicomonas sp. SCSIO W0465]USE34681.1 hypothetical protein MJO57_21460 [Endozoicomonas sp. SCSIO W0465]
MGEMVMSNKIMAIVAVLLLLGAAGWFFLSKNDGPEELPVTDVITIQQDVLQTPMEDRADSTDMEFDELSEETRIILVEPDNGELSDLLSEKVLRDGKIVDKSKTGQ